jgi:hypothetical protein
LLVRGGAGGRRLRALGAWQPQGQQHGDDREPGRPPERHVERVRQRGRVRGDMITLLSDFSQARTTFTTVVMAVFSGLLATSGLTPAEVREKVIADRPQRSDAIFARAHERGEIDLGAVPPVVLTMPFDLMRHDMLMTYKPIPDERVLAIVDDLFLPLVTAQGTS